MLNTDDRPASETDVSDPQKNPPYNGAPNDQPKKHGSHKNAEQTSARRSIHQGSLGVRLH
jgi:hypothetical protein